MNTEVARALWWALTPAQRAMLKRVSTEGSPQHLRPWEMATVRSLRLRGLLRPKERSRDGADHPGRWFLTRKAEHLLVRRSSSDVNGRAIAATGELAPARDMRPTTPEG